MKTRDAVLLYQETQTPDASTRTLDLDLVDPISAIAFEFEATNGTTNNQNNPLPFCVKTIEVVSGSDVLAKLSFRQMQALQFYKVGGRPTLREDEGPSSVQTIACMLLFGRHLWDQRYAFDPARFLNPQLRITWDLAYTRAVAADTAFATGTFKISAIAKVMEDVASRPSEYLMAKEIEAWTGATSGDKRHEMPVDHVYRMLMLLQHNSFAGPEVSISKFKLTCDTDKYIPLERYTKQFNEEMAQLFGNVRVWKRYHAAHGDTIWFPIFKEPQFKAVSTVMGYLIQYGWCWTGNASIFVGDAAGTVVSTDSRFDAEIGGHSLHCSLPIPMGVMDDPATWFDPTPYKKIELVCTEGSATNNTLVTEQVRSL